MTDGSPIPAIAANVEALNWLVGEAAARTAEAHDYLRRGDRNAGIGTILDVDVMLTDAIALYRAAIALHRRSPP
jgi:hypothetical protein